MGAGRRAVCSAVLLHTPVGRRHRRSWPFGVHRLARLRAVSAYVFFSLAVVVQALWLRAGRPGPSPKLWATALAAVLSVLIIWLEFRFALRITIGAFAAVGLYAILLNRMKSKGATQ